MTVHRTHDEQSPGPSCFTVTIEMSLHLISFIYFVWFFLSCLLILVLILILYRYYLLWNQNKIEPTARLIIGSDDERDPEYVPPGTSAPSRAARAPQSHTQDGGIRRTSPGPHPSL